jgi:hypothetical protein
MDHILECQFMAAAALTALSNNAYNSAILGGLKDCLNPDDLTNYNICDKKINIKKGSVIKEFLKNSHTKSNMRFGALALNMFDERVMARLSKTMNDSYPAIIETVTEYKRNGYVGSEFQKVGEELDNLFQSMKLSSP